MTFERRRSPSLAFRTFAPNAPNDITPSQVQCYVAENQWVKAVRLSGGWMQRPQSAQDEWRSLDDELCHAGIDVYFTFGGTCTWEAGFSDGRPPGPARRANVPTMAAEAPFDGVTPIPEGTGPQDSTPVITLDIQGNYSTTIPTMLGNQLVMVYADGGALIDITGPEDDGAASVPVGPIESVTSDSGADGLTEPVLQPETAPAAQFTKSEAEDKIREVAARPGIGGYRKIAAALFTEHGINVSHMTVKRVLDARK